MWWVLKTTNKFVLIALGSIFLSYTTPANAGFFDDLKKGMEDVTKGLDDAVKKSLKDAEKKMNDNQQQPTQEPQNQSGSSTSQTTQNSSSGSEHFFGESDLFWVGYVNKYRDTEYFGGGDATCGVEDSNYSASYGVKLSQKFQNSIFCLRDTNTCRKGRFIQTRTTWKELASFVVNDLQNHKMLRCRAVFGRESDLKFFSEQITHLGLALYKKRYPTEPESIGTSRNNYAVWMARNKADDLYDNLLQARKQRATENARVREVQITNAKRGFMYCGVNVDCYSKQNVISSMYKILSKLGGIEYRVCNDIIREANKTPGIGYSTNGEAYAGRLLEVCNRQLQQAGY